ncbi:MAG: cation:proton antiporter [Phycisphaerae bacterium]|nr:cation:proton antiporter [Phycisphaerae bacterium]MCZ2398419.1 cation:proton antiporter [Phycisphaerae bacterium]NUQ48921.1 cation:proton antiporter [Phycisphaerae bacterium]
MSNFDVSVLFFLQLAAILGACRVVGLVARRLGQPQVVGEMVAGVLLGPSLFGYLAPEGQAALFPAPTHPVLYTVAQVAVAFYMFTVGLEFRFDLLRERAHGAVAVSMAGIATPMALGALLGLAYAGDARLFSKDAAAWEVMLYLGSAMSITAFPMLARIIFERGLTGTRLGALSLAAGSIDDASAWCVLAIVLASFQNEAAIAVWAIGGGLAYVAFVLVVLRPLLRPLARAVEREGKLSRGVLAWVLMLVALGCWFTDWIGIYAVFGGFLMGVAMPRGLLTERLRATIEPLLTAMLVPFFFVWSGLNTRLALVDSPGLWLVMALVLAVAILGKGLACGMAAWMNGEPPRNAVAIGALMNSRGLMELIIANIGLERGIITPTLYCMLVLMAVVTTLMATPAFELALRTRPLPGAAVEHAGI